MRTFAKAALAASALAITGAASAADLSAPRPLPAYKAPIVPVYTWTGFYVGANIGWGWTDGDGTLTTALGGPGPISGSGDGFLGGIQAGYNWQMGNWVLGFETDFDGSAGDGNLGGGPAATPLAATAKTPWFGTVRGRIGYAAGRWLIYGTGGGIYMNEKLDGTIGGVGFSSSTTAWSWVAGAGVETMLWDPRWSAKVEYLHAGTPDEVPTPPGTTGITGNINTDMVRVGLNYRF